MKRFSARWWVLKRTLAWLFKCRAILVCYEKEVSNTSAW